MASNETIVEYYFVPQLKNEQNLCMTVCSKILLRKPIKFNTNRNPSADNLHFLKHTKIHSSYMTLNPFVCKGIGQNGDNSTTFPIISRVGDSNPVDAIFSGRSLSSANTCMIADNNQSLR
ncbi:hypothetical protein MTR_3g026775 [Medicago truncatula]|uniref:Uncharacterized protein n=1 Tax=Medicago truncatula TaxID=3880 RepID=A0A072UTK9_MEDTR|nr:hypothetical protein MTR_3g026775 [Medicago truncatula]